MLRDAWLVAGKDLRIEIRSRVATNQIVPLAVLILMLFAFALGPGRQVLAPASSGLFWLAVLITALLAIQRSFAVETGEGAQDALRLMGLDSAGVFLGKMLAIAAQLVLIEVIIGAGVVFLYGAALHGMVMVLLSCFFGTIGLAAAGTIYGALAAGLRVRETLLPLLFLPIVAPVLLSGTKAWDAALAGTVSQGWPWIRLLGVFSIIYLVAGVVSFGPLMEAA